MSHWQQSQVEELQDEVILLRQVELDLGTLLTAAPEKAFPEVPDSKHPIWLKVLHLPDGWVVEIWTHSDLQAQVAGDSLVECLCLLGEKK